MVEIIKVNELDEKVQKINSLHEELISLLHQGIEKAIEIGELLTAKKAELPHGEFGTWIKVNLIFTDRTAQRYMKLYENRDRVLEAGNISEAYGMLGDGKNDTVSDLDNVLYSYDFDSLTKKRYALNLFPSICDKVKFTPTNLEISEDLSYDEWLILGRTIGIPMSSMANERIRQMLNNNK